MKNINYNDNFVYEKIRKNKTNNYRIKHILNQCFIFHIMYYIIYIENICAMRKSLLTSRCESTEELRM